MYIAHVLINCEWIALNILRPLFFKLVIKYSPPYTILCIKLQKFDAKSTRRTLWPVRVRSSSYETNLRLARLSRPTLEYMGVELHTTVC